MPYRGSVHIIVSDALRRGAIARLVYDARYHAEVYDGLAEFFLHAPSTGIILADDEQPGHLIPELFAQAARVGRWLPVIAIATAPERHAVVAAVKAGVLEYLAFPLTVDSLSAAIENVLLEAGSHRAQRDRIMGSQARISQLSQREREVLDRLAEGMSNKEIARSLAISPRTVEIHRMKMMGKLGIKHPAEAVRMLMYATDFQLLAA